MINISTAWLTTNYTCNCKCNWCYAQRTFSKCNYMELGYAKKLVRYLKEKGVKTITLIGGEPTLYPNLIELINTIKRENMQVRLVTNGFMFKEEKFVEKIISTKIDGINISIKGATEEEYYTNTKRYGLYDMLKGYKNLKTKGMNPTFSYVVTDNNTKKFGELINMLQKEQINKLIIQFEKPVLNLKLDNKTMDIRQMGSFVQHIYNCLEKTDIDYTIEISFPLCLIEESLLNQMIKEGRIFTCCHVQKGLGIAFNVEGKMIPCNHFLEYPFCEERLDLNDINSIEKLQKGKTFQKFKDTVKRYPSEKCIECKMWNICGGGCFTRWFYIDPKSVIK